MHQKYFVVLKVADDFKTVFFTIYNICGVNKESGTEDIVDTNYMHCKLLFPTLNLSPAGIININKPVSKT